MLTTSAAGKDRVRRSLLSEELGKFWVVQELELPYRELNLHDSGHDPKKH
jgi:hypothetical protein